MMEEEMQELETLRAEKHQRMQTERAEAALAQAGVPGAFASLLVGRDDADTDARVERFRNTYQAALAEDVRQRLPQQAPVVMTPTTPQRSRRGIQRIR